MPDYSVWIESEEGDPQQWDPADDASDAIVTFPDGTRWVSSFVTYRHVSTLVDRNRASGESLGGKYLWASDLILIDSTSRASIEAVVADLISHDEFEAAFTRLEEEDA